LPGLLSGERIGTMAMFEGPGSDPVRGNTASVRAGRLSGRKTAVPDGAIADLVVVVAESEGQPGLFLAARGEGLEVRPTGGIDPSHPPAVMVFDGAPVERLGAAGRHDLDRSLDRAAVLIAFEQLGTADAALELARTYALQRKAFGRAIGSFQAIKHKLVDVWTTNELARANAHYAAWCLAFGADDSALAAATSWVAAAEAGERAARELIQVHGGIGVTWEHDAHLFYRRARHLSLALGGTARWRRALVTGLANRTAGI
jgi:alkylation response protein AidB-like acyl-CoA dehydrogenase